MPLAMPPKRLRMLKERSRRNRILLTQRRLNALNKLKKRGPRLKKLKKRRLPPPMPSSKRLKTRRQLKPKRPESRRPRQSRKPINLVMQRLTLQMRQQISLRKSKRVIKLPKKLPPWQLIKKPQGRRPQTLQRPKMRRPRRIPPERLLPLRRRAL